MSMSRKRILVTGAGGFVGRTVASAVAEGVFGDAEMLAPMPGWDIQDADATQELVARGQPTHVLHLAAQSFVPRSFIDPVETLSINVIGTANLLKALEGEDFAGRFVYISSGDVYGAVADDDLPVDEHSIPRPRSPYGVSKIAAEQLCLQAHRRGRLDCVIARPFNHVGPGQAEQFVLPSLALQIARIERGEAEPRIDVGDIDSTRDFSDVRDVVAAYAAMLDRGTTGSTYIVASGIERSVRDLLQLMLDKSGVRPLIHQDPARMRPSEQRRMVAESSLLQRDTGWRPQISIDTTISNLLDYARNLK